MSRAETWNALDAEWQCARRELEAKRKAMQTAAEFFARAVIDAKYPDVIAECRAEFEAADAAVDAAREAEHAAYRRREDFAARSAA